MKALVIDDSRATRRLITRLLTKFGFEAHDEPLATTALAHLNAGHEYDIALVDVNMPEMNGIEFVRAVRQDTKWDQMFLFMVTSDSSETRMVEAIEAGADEYFLKPVREDALKSKLELLGFEFE